MLHPEVYENIEKQSKKEHEKAQAALTCCLYRLGETYSQEESTPTEQESENSFSPILQKGTRNLLQLLPCSIETISHLFHPSDFKQNKVLTKRIQKQNIPEDVLVGNIFEFVANDARIVHKVEKALQVFEESAKSVCSHNSSEVMEFLSEHVEKDTETQMGLLILSENFFPVPMIDRIIPADCLQSEEFPQTLGTVVMASLIEREHLSVKEIEKLVSTTDLNQHKIKEEQILIEEIVDNLRTSPLKFEMLSMKNYDPIKRGLRAVKNVITAKRYGASYEGVIKFIENETINFFEVDAVQMPFLTVAKRISNPMLVKNIIIQEQLDCVKTSTLIGMQVLLKVIEKIAYNVSNINDFLYPTDLLQENVLKERALLAQYAQQVESLATGNEIPQMMNINEDQQKFQSAVTDLVLDLQLPVSINNRIIIEPSSLDEILCNIQGQSCLFDIAERLSNDLFVRQIVTTEALKHGGLPKFPGLFAIRKVLENTHIQQTDVITMLSDQPCKLEKIDRYLAACQSITALVKTTQEY